MLCLWTVLPLMSALDVRGPQLKGRCCACRPLRPVPRWC